MVVSYKNQKFKSIIKKVIIGDSRCGNKYILNTKKHCPCNYINPYLLLSIYLDRTYKYALNNKYFNINKDVNLLRFKYNKDAVVSDLCNIAKEITVIARISEPERYTSYAFRIGGSSLGSNNHIPHPKILKYVGWKPANLPHVSYRYMCYTEIHLSSFIKELIHGYNYNGLNTLHHNQNISAIYDPWANSVDYKNW